MQALRHPIIKQLLRTEMLSAVLVVALALLMTLVDAVTLSILPALLNLIQDVDAEKLPAILKIWTDLLSFLTRTDQIITLLFIIVGGIVIKNLLYGMSLYVAYGLNSRLSEKLRLQIMQSVAQRNQQYLDDTTSGTIIENVMSQPHELGLLGRGFTDLIINLVSLLVYSAFLLVLSPDIALLTAGFGVIAVVVVTLYNRWTGHLSFRWMESRYQLSNMIVETIQGMLTVKMHNRIQDTLDKIKDANQSERHTWRIRAVFGMMTAPLTEILGAIFIGFVIVWVVSTPSPTNTAQLTVLIAFIVVLVRMLVPLKEANRSRTLINNNWVVLEEVFRTLGEDSIQYTEQAGNAELTFDTQIQFTDVTFFYFNDPTPVLNKVNLSIPRGQLTVIIGQSGSGKSTLVKLLLNLYRAQTGKITIDETPIEEYTLESLRDNVAYVEQKAFLFNDTIKANIAFGAPANHIPTTAEIEAAARRAIAHDFITDLPQGYDTVIGEKGASISGGQQQRIALARAFMRDASILVLDEATSALDQLTEQHLLTQLNAWRQDKTIIIVTHRIEIADVADWLIVMQDGHITRQGKPSDLKDTEGNYGWLYEYAM